MPIDDLNSASLDHLEPGAERRAKLRIDVLGQIEAHSVWRLRPLHLRELSETGFSLEATGSFDADVIHKFRIGMDTLGRSVVVQAKTKHCKLASMSGALPIYITGFELVGPSDNTRREIRALMRFADSMWQEEQEGGTTT